LECEVDRRRFLQWSSALASLAAASSVLGPQRAAALVLSQTSPDALEGAAGVQFKFSVCQMCHGRCGIMCKIKDGVLLKIDGNPYHPNNMHFDERLPFDTPAEQAARVRGRLCLKGQAGIQTLYDPYRVKQPLKRVGPRGSGKWQAISWDQALDEIAAKLKALRRFDVPANPAAPEAGPAVNAVLFAPGRTVEGDFSDRIWRDGYGTENYRLDHTSICEVDHHVAYELVTWEKAKKAGRKSHFKPDLLSCDFTILFGSNPLEANFALVPLARNLMEMKKRGGKYVVVDPRFSNAAAQADQWVPIIPGTDAALALGMARWIIDNRRYDERYLRNANKPAAAADGEPTWSDATWLVNQEPADPNERKYLRASEIGGSTDNYVVWDGGAPREVTPDAPVEGVLDTGEVVVNGRRCKSVFTLFTERVHERTIAEYSAICGIPAETIEALAREFTSHGKRAATEHYRGAVQHTNGAYNSFAIIALDTLIGCYDWKGGSTAGGGGYAQNTGLLDVTKVPNKVSHAGVRIDRTKGKRYETDGKSFFDRDGYPAKRPWFPYATHGNFQEVIPSAADGYPYNAKAIITYWNAWPYSTPALREVYEEYVRDESRCELFVAISVNIGEVAALADYILPDTTYLEKFAFPGMTPSVITKATSFQQPVVGTFDAQMNYQPILPGTKMYMDILLELGKRMGVPGVGANAFEDGGSLDRAWDFTRRQLDNLAKNAGDALRRPVTVDEIMAKGGVFADPGTEYDGAKLVSQYANEVHLYIEELATSKDSMTGKFFDPLPKYEPPSHADGTPITDDGYPFRLITYKSVRHGQARTATNPWLMALYPENFVDMSSADAAAMGVETGDKVLVSSPSSPAGIVGKAWVTEGLRPGVVAISHHFGHWELGSRAVEIDGVAQSFDPSRGAGLQPTLIMRRDATLGNVALQSKVGGSVSFYDTRVKIEKVRG
jgi:anaerobic selenocysteine-containing dehydrogenase